MRNRMFALTLCAVMLLSLAGCAASADAQAEATPAPAWTREPAVNATPEAASPSPEPESAVLPEGRVTVEVKTAAENVADPETGTELLSYAEARPVVTVEGRAEAEEDINRALTYDYRLFVDGDGVESEYNITGREGYLAAARDDYAYHVREGIEDSFLPYMLRRSVTVRRADERVLSLTYDDVTYTGGAHGYALRTGVNFDTRTGQRLSLQDLADDPYAFMSNCMSYLGEVSRDAEHAVYLSAYFDDYMTWLEDVLNGGGWYFAGEGIVVVANPYEIAPYAAGRIEFTLPYAWLSWQIKAEYMPPESAADGEIAGGIVDRIPESDFQASNGEYQKILFTAHGTVEDVELCQIDFSPEDNTFRRGGTVWYAGRMNDGETLSFTTDIPEILPNVMLRYVVRNGAVREFLLSQSGMDGALVFQNAQSYVSLPLEISNTLPYDYDLDGDWENDTIDLVSTQNGRWQLTVNDVPASGEAYAMDAELLTLWLADIDHDGVIEIYFSGDMGSDDYVTCAWRGDTLQPIPFTGERRKGGDGTALETVADGRAAFSGSLLFLDSWTYQLGTYRSVCACAYADGVLKPVLFWDDPEDAAIWKYPVNGFALTVKKALPVTIDGRGEALLPPGSKITLTGTSGGTVHFVTDAGETGSLALTYHADADGFFTGWLIDGESEDGFFEMIPYVG